MTDNKIIRIQSAPFINYRQNNINKICQSKPANIVNSVPMSESTYMMNRKTLNNQDNKGLSASRFMRAKTSSSSSRNSFVWRIINSTRSEFRLRNLIKTENEEAVRINL
jgi:hypothetical protein